MDRRFRLAVPNASGTTRRFSLAVGTSCTGVADPGTIRQGAHQGSWVVADSSRSTAMVHAKIRRYRRPMDHGRSLAARTDRVKQSPQAWPETSDSADVSEFRLRKLMQSSASSFVISNAVRDTWLSTGIHPLGGPDRRLFVRRLLADHCAEGAQIINSAPIQAARRTSWMTIGCPAVVSQLGMACSTSGSSIIAAARPGWPGPDSTRIGIRITAGSAAGKLGRPAGLLDMGVSGGRADAAGRSRRWRWWWGRRVVRGRRIGHGHDAATTLATTAAAAPGGSVPSNRTTSA